MTRLPCIEISDAMVERAAESYGIFIAEDNGWEQYDGWMDETRPWRIKMARGMLAAALGQERES